MGARGLYGYFFVAAGFLAIRIVYLVSLLIVVVLHQGVAGLPRSIFRQIACGLVAEVLREPDYCSETIVVL